MVGDSIRAVGNCHTLTRDFLPLIVWLPLSSDRSVDSRSRDVHEHKERTVSYHLSARKDKLYLQLITDHATSSSLPCAPCSL